MLDIFKKLLIKRIIILIATLSDKNFIRAINLAERYFIKEKSTRSAAETIKEAFMNKHPAIELVRNTFKRLSKNSKNKLIENFFVNWAILGKNRQAELEKKLGFGLPSFFVISPTAKCNLKCIGCYASEYRMEDSLPYQEIDRILTEAKKLGIYFITISGGEPFMYPHMLDVFKKHNDIFFQVYTNGTLIDKNLAKKLAELGNVAPAISVEGFEKETEQRRGPAVFKKVMQAMDNLREAGVLFGFSATPTRLNSEVLSSDKFIDLMISKGASFGWFFQYIPIGRKPNTKLMSTPKQRYMLRERISKIRETKPVFVGDFWNDGQYVGGCMAGARSGGYFHINCQGDVEPCVFMQFHVDNIRGKRLIDVIQSPFFKALQREQPYCKNKNLMTPCAIIDNPKVLRKIIKECGAKPSYNSSYDIIKDQKVCKFLDSYSKEFKKKTDPIWDKELSKTYKHWKEYRKVPPHCI